MSVELKKKISVLMRDVLIVYLASSFIIIVSKAFFAYFNGEDLFNSIMLNFRTYLFAIIVTEKKFMQVMFDSIEYLQVLPILFFALFFCVIIFDKEIGITKKSIIKCMICFAIAMLSILITNLRFPFCILQGLTISGVIYIIICSCEKWINLFIFRIVIILYSVICVILSLMPYFEFFE